MVICDEMRHGMRNLNSSSNFHSFAMLCCFRLEMAFEGVASCFCNN